ncbi:MAG: diguanylate cyclase [Gammaproteobacteria bacterium]|nr:MAG: diguanylate cyclase [Gammaproteobacteria bacterium]
MQIALLKLSNKEIPGIEEHKHIFITEFISADNILESDIKFDVVLIISNIENEIISTTKELRSENHLIPIFVSTGLEKNKLKYNAYIDGYYESFEDFYSKCSSIIEIGNSLINRGVNDQDNKILEFLLCRPDYVAQPIKDWKSRKIYTYPILNVFADEGTDTEQWMQTLHNRDLIAQVELVGRIRECPFCGSAHLMFVDICPNCQSIDIVNVPFIHCFTCGNIEPQEKFISGDSLNCPRCMTHLRHIGVDYDRPLENHLCNSCGHIFEEPNVIANCAECGNNSKSEELITIEKYSFQLSEHGKVVTQHDNISDVIKILDNINYAHLPYFQFITNWLISMYKRQNDMNFSIVGLNLDNMAQLINTIGRGKASMILHGFAESLRKLVRTSDICTRSSETHFWLLLPQTDSKGCEQFIKRLNDIKHVSEHEGGEALSFTIESYSSDKDFDQDETSELIMAALSSRLS